MVLVILAVPPKWQDGFVVTFASGIVLLSVVVVTGYAGQLSLAQFALAGFAALIAGRLVDAGGWPFSLALLAAVLATVPLGGAVRPSGGAGQGYQPRDRHPRARNCARVPGVQQRRPGGRIPGHGSRPANVSSVGTSTPSSIPGRYAIVSMGFFTVVASMVANVRRGRAGRRLLAVRTNERAAAALGISVIEAKVYAFALSAGIAAHRRHSPVIPKGRDHLQVGVPQLQLDPGRRRGRSSAASAICSVRSPARCWPRVRSEHRSPMPSSPASPNGSNSSAASSSCFWFS